MHSRHKSGYREVADHLESLIVSGALPPGNRLPSLRELCHEFGISLGTAVRGQKILEEKGMIEVRRGSGAYVASRKIPPSAGWNIDEIRKIRIAAFIAENELLESYCAHAMRGVQDQAILNGCSIYLNHLPVFTARPSLEKLDEMSELCDAVLMLGEYDLHLESLPGRRPYVGVEMHNDYGGICSTVSMDPIAAAEQACRYFLKERCTMVKAVVIPHLPVHHQRALQFMEAWKRHGRIETVIYRDPASRDEITAMDISDPDCGYWFSSGTICQRLALPYRLRTGRHLAADRKVVALDGKSLVVKCFEPMNTIGIDWYEAGTAAFEECRRRVANPGSPARRIYLNCRFNGFDSRLSH